MDEEITRDLTPQQMEALTEVQTVTQAANPRREVEELRKANWNVQVALQAIFDDTPAAGGSSTAPAPPANVEQMELDDTMQGSSSSRRAPAVSVIWSTDADGV
ncbi:hypothetical protein RhiLY_06163 [Ceratobasidium sp. AG-Ba]|nr:hypothetical protein RhiLY_06163 [Ceratobasidium sp. AG-Ba]